MAVDSTSSSLFQILKLDDPYLPSKPWESISTESGLSPPPNSSSAPSTKPLYDHSTVSEINLVRLVINALQGVESTLLSIEKLSESFSTDSADRTWNRIPSLWYRASSTNALGKILKTISRSGFVVFLLRKFVDYFLGTQINDENGSESGNGASCTHSLVNQAFAVAVRKVLEGFICSSDTLYASVKLRRSPNNGDTSAHNSSGGVGCLTSVVHSEITVLEVYLHTKDLRTQIEAVGNLCSFKDAVVGFSASSIDELTAEAIIGFSNFPRGANLLSYLYAQLRDADPVHQTLIEFLFLRSCEPYCAFIKSWIYQASISDPYKEFIVEYVGDSPLYSNGGPGFSNGNWLSSVKLRDGVSVPCFMDNFCLPLLRAGQQLQVLIKLLELCHCLRPGGQTYDDILPCWIGSSNDYLSRLSPLTFSKSKIEEMVLMRENMYQKMQEKLHILFTRLDIKYQPMSCNVMPCGTTSNIDSLNVPVSFTIDDKRIIASTADERDSISEADESESYASIDGISSEADPLESSEWQSWNSSGQKNVSDEGSAKHGSSIEELRYLSASSLLTNLCNGNVSPNPFQSEKLHAMDYVCDETVERMKSTKHFGHFHEESKLNDISEHAHSGGPTCSRFTVYTDYQSVSCWPLGGLSKNPFIDEKGCRGGTPLPLTNCSVEGSDRSNKVLKGEVSYSKEVYELEGSLQVSGNIQLRNGIPAPSKSFISPSWNLKYNNNVFNMNPMITKNTWCHMVDNSSARSYASYKKPSLFFFDFSSVEDPHKVYGERMLPHTDDKFKDEHCLVPDYSVPAKRGVVEHFEEQGHERNDALVGQRKSLSAAFENLVEENHFTSASGGAEWESSLNYLSRSVKTGGGAHDQSSGTTFNMPLDVIIDKCILQEILLQYKYVSNFTIKLLEDGFDLREHLLALRRYHFMEFADWADLFIMSLWRHKWFATEASQRISEIQGFLDSAVQRSSCEGDPYKERLFIHMKADGKAPLSMAATGVHAFDFVALGYRVDWPISIIITPSALQIYADIFSFLIQVKLALFSLTDVWRSLKDFVHSLGQPPISKLNERDRTDFSTIMRMRHQVNHFVSSLQQYVQSQLSHVSWCRFLHSIKHQVKDMLDLESVHMAYLADSLHICFLSDEKRSVAGIIESILQCAVDFRSCFTGCCWEIGLDYGDLPNLFAQINIPQVLNIKTTFERNLKELYVCYLKCPKHGEFSISDFWEYLNYNDYYSSVISNRVVRYVS